MHIGEQMQQTCAIAIASTAASLVIAAIPASGLV
jgi:hypothetical protein